MSRYTDVLIVEDDAWFAELYARMLNGAGYSSTSVSNGYSAMDAVDAYLPKVIILDMFLAGGTAMTLLHELQSYDDTGKIPVILCTNTATHFAVRDMAQYGVERILDKATMHPEDIASAVKGVLL